MPTPIEAMTTAALSSALDLAVRRHALTAANIAHASSEDYLAQRVPFESRLEEIRAGKAGGGFLDPGSLEALRGLSGIPPESVPGKVQVDREMTELARNAVQFQTLVQGLARHLSLLALAAADGRR